MRLLFLVLGLPLTACFRGTLGMAILILISYVFSANRKAINWKTVSFGLIGQLILAIGVLKCLLFKSIFEVISRFLLRCLIPANGVFLLVI